MEIETQGISSFGIQSNSPYSYSLDNINNNNNNNNNNISPPDFRGTESPPMDTPKCESIQSEVVVINGGGDSVGPTEMASEVDAGAVVKLQKMYRGYRTRRRFADYTVVTQELWWQATDYARLNHSTTSFFLKPESPASRWNRIGSNASKVGKGLSRDVKAQKLAFQHWIEAIDPRHRYGHNLHLYYEEWCKTNAGQPFFYWLDIGDGKGLDLTECPRSKLRQQSIIYLGPIVHKQTGDLLGTDKGSEGAKWIFVMSTSMELYAGEKKKGLFHHSSFLAGGATIAAGTLEAELGALKSISPYSGHYRPTDDSLDSFLSILKENGVNLNDVKIHKASEDSDSYDDGKSNGTIVEAFSNLKPPELEIPKEEEKNLPLESSEVNLTVTKSEYKRTLTGIGLVADYPEQLRAQALEFVNLSPRTPSTPSPYRRFAGLASRTAPLVSPTAPSTSDMSYGDGTSGV